MDPEDDARPRLAPGPDAGAHAVHITERDRLVLAFAAEHRLVQAAHVGVLLGIKTTTAAARLNALATTGLLESDHRLHGQPSWYRIRPPGLRMIASGLPPPRRADLDAHRHDVGVAWLWLAAHERHLRGPDRIVSERRMRSHDGTAEGREQPFGVRLGGARARMAAIGGTTPTCCWRPQPGTGSRSSSS